MNRTTRDLRAPALHALTLLLLAAGGAAAQPAETPPAPPPEEAFDWTRGAWEGVRRDGADGSEARMLLVVNPILDGAGLMRDLRVVHDDGTYRGLSLQMMERETGRWVEIYANAVHGRFVRLEGEIEESGGSGADRSVWRPVDPNGERLSRLVSERIPPDRWRRTMNVSDDGGETWRVLWTDELKRKRGL